MSDEKRWVVVTGASTGIGRDCAIEFLKLGFSVYGVARTLQALDGLIQRAQELGRDFVPIALDLSQPESSAQLFSQTRDAEILVNNAGVGMHGEFHRLDWHAQERMMRLNMFALTELTYLFAGQFRERGRGRILQVASTAGFLPGPSMAVYYATKAYVLSLSVALSRELRETGITVTALCPGPTLTEFQRRAMSGVPNLFKGPFVMTSAAVAKIGVEACLGGQQIVVPGFLNRLSTWISHLLPRTILARVAERLMRIPSTRSIS